MATTLPAPSTEEGSSGASPGSKGVHSTLGGSSGPPVRVVFLAPAGPGRIVGISGVSVENHAVLRGGHVPMLTQM